MKNNIYNKYKVIIKKLLYILINGGISIEKSYQYFTHIGAYDFLDGVRKQWICGKRVEFFGIAVRSSID